MREIFRPAATALSIACLALAMSAISSGDVLAQAKQAPPKQTAPAQAAPPPAAEAPAIKQIALTEKQIEGVLAAQKDVDAIVDKLPDDAKPDPKVDVQLDGIELQQILLNLIRNAIDAMSSSPPDARRLRLKTSFDGHSTVLISVQDSGPGIPAGDQERIFDPFYTTKHDGMGLGLAISSTLVERQGGKLRLVKSDSSGSIFELDMPVGGQRSAA